ncbi:LysM peptidoglycan-binding domain-containing protein [Facklamia miroungae]|uniref:LysM domain-containing protein n=1 Tax=Facklamia miroungae TaxID=120956 RepID=A0A1G7V3G7_9LACT|nr:LysM peptidoglycan-binding domain-containing protein [Facklamia miroungae]NKZ30234.1 LysM peptidoglycan-binding domain-containing protein [Facklamia miroungae]SDG54108.1 LysM domain-containing protein [Facklamia miroungae]
MKKSITSLVISSFLLQVSPVQTITLAQENNVQDNLVVSWKQRTADEIRRAIRLMTLNQDKIYIIQWGDTLRSISEATGISVNDLAQINQISDPDLIIAGAELRFNNDLNTISYSQGEDEVTVLAYETEKESLNSQFQTEQSLFTLEEAEDFKPENDHEVSTSGTEVIPVVEKVETTVETGIEEVINASSTTSLESFESQSTTQAFEEINSTDELTTRINVLNESSETEASTITTTSLETTSYVEPTYEETTVETIQESIETTNNNYASNDPGAAFEQIVAEKGISDLEKGYWEAIINRESGWNIYAQNSSSGAYGLPQALPGSKMASHGADWQSNPYTQLAWMYDYMVSRYGSISGAWSHSQSRGWY